MILKLILNVYYYYVYFLLLWNIFLSFKFYLLNLKYDFIMSRILIEKIKWLMFLIFENNIRIMFLFWK